MSRLALFVRAGLADADRRIGRLTAPATLDEPWVLTTIASGTIARTLVHTLQRCGAAIQTSACVRMGRSLTAPWLEAGWAIQRRASGALLLVAAVVHVLLILRVGVPPGWLWIMPPAVAAALGGLLWLAGSPPVRRTE